MKTILVLTDFSENAIKAAETAAMLSGPLNANLLLFNANYTVPAIPYYPGVVLVNENISWEDECEDKLSHLAEHITKIVSQANVDQRKPHVRTLLKEGNLLNNVSEIIEKEKVEMIIMGGQSGSKVDHFFWGSDISAIIDHVNCPVMIVSSNRYITRLSKVVFASDFHKGDRDAITYLMELAKLFQYQLEIVHVSLYSSDKIAEDPLVLDFIHALEESNYPNVTYKDIRGKDLIQRLSHICEEREADLLAFTHQQHSYLAKILKEGSVKRSIARQNLPLLIFPSAFHHKYHHRKKNH